MKISTKVECGIIALIDIYINSENNNAVTVVNISKRQNISAKYLEQILPSLRHANIIRSVKGARGGYVISRPGNNITLKEVIDALDTTVLSDVSFEDSGSSLIIDAISDCLWSEMTEFLQKFTKNITLADIVDRYNTLVEENTTEPMYYI